MQAKPTRIVIEAEDLTWTQNVLAAHGDLLAVGLDIRKPGVFDVRVTLDQAGASRYVVRDMATHHLWHHEDRHLLAEFCEQTSNPSSPPAGSPTSTTCTNYTNSYPRVSTGSSSAPPLQRGVHLSGGGRRGCRPVRHVLLGTPQP